MPYDSKIAVPSYLPSNANDGISPQCDYTEACWICESACEWCESSEGGCTSGCEVSDEGGCVGGQCSQGCSGCQSTCETDCQSSCENACQGCQRYCQSSCEISCQSGESCYEGCGQSCSMGCTVGCMASSQGSSYPTFNWSYAGINPQTGKIAEGAEKMAGYGVYVTAAEWNGLVEYVNSLRGTSIAAVRSGDPISAAAVNLVASALGVSQIEKGAPLTAAFFNSLRSAYNAKIV